MVNLAGGHRTVSCTVDTLKGNQVNIPEPGFFWLFHHSIISVALSLVVFIIISFFLFD